MKKPTRLCTTCVSWQDIELSPTTTWWGCFGKCTNPESPDYLMQLGSTSKACNRYCYSTDKHPKQYP